MTNEKHLGNKVLFYWGKDFLFFFEYIKCISDHEYQTKKKGNKEMAKHNSVFLIGSVNWISYSKSDSTEKIIMSCVILRLFVKIKIQKM